MIVRFISIILMLASFGANADFFKENIFIKGGYDSGGAEIDSQGVGKFQRVGIATPLETSVGGTGTTTFTPNKIIIGGTQFVSAESTSGQILIDSSGEHKFVTLTGVLHIGEDGTTTIDLSGGPVQVGGLMVVPDGDVSSKFWCIQNPFIPQQMVFGITSNYSSGYGNDLFFGFHSVPGSPYPLEYRTALGMESNGNFHIDTFKPGLVFNDRPLSIGPESTDSFIINRPTVVNGDLQIGNKLTGAFKIDLVNNVQCTLPEAHISNGSYMINSAGTAGNIWTSNGSGRGSWAVPTIDLSNDNQVQNVLGASHIANSSYFISSAGTAGQVWLSDGTDAGVWGSLDLSNANAITGNLPLNRFTGNSTAQTLLIPNGTSAAQWSAPATRSILLTAYNGKPTTTSGCNPASVIEEPTNKIDVYALEFVHTSKTYAFWNFVLPYDYNGGTFNALIYLRDTVKQDSPTPTTHWGIAGGVYRSGSTLDTALGSVKTRNSDSSGPGKLNVNSILDITFAGSPVAGDFVVVRIYRDPTNANDDYDQTACLVAVKLEYASKVY